MLILILLGAFLWRLQGGLVHELTGKANYYGLDQFAVRVIYAVGLSLAFWILYPKTTWLETYWLGSSFFSDVLGFFSLSYALYLGVSLVGWYGVDLHPKTLEDTIIISISGFLRMLPVTVLLLSPWPIIIGLLFGPVYRLGYKLPVYEPSLFWGEIFAGALIGFSLSLS